ncbi:MAG: thioredoxin family protein [Balneolaceae bacterium]
MTTLECLISPDLIENAQTYDEHRSDVEELLQAGKTTGENHSESLLHYTKMNIYRMKRLDKRAELLPSLKERLRQMERKMVWLVLTEGWCGDAAQTIPVIHKMAAETSFIELKIILRDQHLELMDQFLMRDKSRSIPKLIALDAMSLDVLGTWGPRPHTAQQIVDNMQMLSGAARKESSERLHKWYADNRSQELQQEFEQLLDEWEEA